MAVYLLSWDPMRWDWRNIKEQAEQVARGAPLVRSWSCGTNRRIFNGDIVYIIRQGREPRGIFARGEVVRGSYEARNVDVQDAVSGRGTLVIDIRFTALENAVEKVVLPRQGLSGGPLGKFIWDIRESGAKLPEAVATALEKAWQETAIGRVDDKSKTTAKKTATTSTQAAPAKSDATGKAPPAPADTGAPARTPTSETPEQQRLQQERAERLLKIKQREKKARDSNASADVAFEMAASVTPERRNEILVQNYFIMLDAELQGELYSKADHRNRVMQELGDADADAVNRAHRHISGVLAETGLPFADGFPPESGFDAAIEKAVHVFIEANPELIEALWLGDVPPAASIPVELDDAKAHWVPMPEKAGFRPSGRAAWHPAGVNEIDMRVREGANRNLAMAGERFVLAFERARLREAGMKDSANQVAWQSQTFGDSFGYDIRSLNEDGSERLICVKTTNYGMRHPFGLTYRELERAREHKAAFLVYRVFRFSRGAKLFMIAADQLLKETPEPIEFRCWV